MKDDNIYVRKDNGRYTPIGVCVNKDYMYDGLWYVKHRPGCTSTTSVPYMANLFHIDNDPVDVNLICSMKDMVDMVFDSKEYHELMKTGSYSLHDIVATVVKVIYDNNPNINGESNGNIDSWYFNLMFMQFLCILALFLNVCYLHIRKVSLLC